MDMQEIMNEWDKSINQYNQMIEYINEMIDKDADEYREEWDKNIEHFSDLILNFINTLSKATSQVATLNGIIKTLQEFKGDIYISMSERFKNEIN